MARSGSMGRMHTREDSGLRLDREGRWWHDDVAVEHPKIIEAFNQGLSPTEDGRFILKFGHDWCFVVVEDAAYRVVAVERREDGALVLRLSDRSCELLDLPSLQVEEDGVAACQVKGRRAKARFTRDAQFQLGELAELVDGRLELRVGEAHVVLARGSSGPEESR